MPYSKAQTAIGVVFYGHKERGPGGFKPEPHKRRRRALESHSKEVFKSSAKYYTNFNIFNQIFFACLKDFCKTHGFCSNEAGVEMEISHVLLGFIPPHGKSCEKYPTAHQVQSVPSCRCRIVWKIRDFLLCNYKEIIRS
jgi:hypothetical protein